MDELNSATQGKWQRLHPLSPVARLGPALVGIAFVAVDQLGNNHGSNTSKIYLIGASLLTVLAGVIAWIVTRWRIEDQVVEITSGLLRRRYLRLPIAQLQAVDVVEPTVARMLGLAEVRMRMAGSSSTAGRLAYLSKQDAQALRSLLLSQVRHSSERTEIEERPILQVSVSRLLISLLLDRVTIELLLWATVVVIVGVFVSAHAADGLIGGSITVFLTLFISVARRFNAGYEMTISESSDGLHLQGGLVSQSAETIPRRRVQAARIVRPPLWRPFGWSRLDVQVAGGARSERRGAGYQQRSVRNALPVGTDVEAGMLLTRVFPQVPLLDQKPPRRACWKSPLRFHFLAWGLTDSYIATSSGRLRRSYSYVPLSKVQSLRFVQGPIQRFLHLGTIHIDTAGRGVHAVIRDCDVDISRRLQLELPSQCKSARERENSK